MRAWQIPEYWIINPHREKVTVLTLEDEMYQEKVSVGDDAIASPTDPALTLTASALLQGKIS